MYIPLWALVVAALVFLVLLRLALRGAGGPGIEGGGGSDMVERQRRANPSPPLPAAEAAAPLAHPDVAAPLAAGRKIEAIKAVRRIGGLGLKDAKDLVEEEWRSPLR